MATVSSRFDQKKHQFHHRVTDSATLRKRIVGLLASGAQTEADRSAAGDPLQINRILDAMLTEGIVSVSIDPNQAGSRRRKFKLEEK